MTDLSPAVIKLLQSARYNNYKVQEELLDNCSVPTILVTTKVPLFAQFFVFNIIDKTLHSCKIYKRMSRVVQ